MTSTAVRRSGLLVLDLVLLNAGVAGAVLVGLGCDENVYRGTARGDVCMALGELGGPRWWLLAGAPAVLFLAGAFTRWGRRRRAALAGAMLIALTALDALLIAIVTSNFLG